MFGLQIYPIGDRPALWRAGAGPTADLGRRRFDDILRPFDG